MQIMERTVCISEAPPICRFPLFVAIHNICSGVASPDSLYDALCRHPVHEMGIDEAYMKTSMDN